MKILNFLLTKSPLFAILSLALFKQGKYGGIAQLARARGSYPRCHWFESSCRYHVKQRTCVRSHIGKRPGGQAVKTPPFHGGNTGSSPVRVTTFPSPFLSYGGIAQPVERPPHTRKVTDSSSVVSTKKSSEIVRFRNFFFCFCPKKFGPLEMSCKCPVSGPESLASQRF